MLSVFLSSVAYPSDLESFSGKRRHKKKDTKKKEIELAVVAIFRDEARFLREWIEYYSLQGVGKFYLFDNLSEDNCRDVLRPYIDKGIVELCDWHIESQDSGYWNHVQVTAYAHGMDRARADGAQWVIVIDVDEYMVPMNHENILSLVREYNATDVGMLSALWLMFGTSNVSEVPAGQLMIETLRYNGGLGSRIGEKSILHTQRTDIGGPHYGVCRPGYRGLRLPWEVMQINHYWSRDERFFYEVKVPRRVIWGWSQEYSENFMNSFNKDEFVEFSGPIQRFVGPLRQRMGLSK